MSSFKALLSAIALTTSVVSPAAHAEWEVIQQVDEWDRPTEKKIALSPIYLPDPDSSEWEGLLDSFDYATSIRVRHNPGGVIPHDCEMALIFAKEPDLKEEKRKGVSFHTLGVLIDNKETVALAGKIAPKVFVFGGMEGEFDAMTLALADSLEMIIPHKVGNHLIEFDMTGAKRAIAEVCEF